MTRLALASGQAARYSALSAPNGFTKAKVSAIGRSYLWIADQDLMITVQTNSQPPEGTDKLGEAVNTLYEFVGKPRAK
jgi:hypothetical protein